MRSLSSRNTGRQPSHIKDSLGTLTKTYEEKDCAWLAHLSAVFAGSNTPLDEIGRREQCDSDDPRVGFTLQDTRQALARLRRNRSMGPDGMPAEVLLAGGEALVHHAHASC